jgi:spore maturation protein CgeB
MIGDAFAACDMHPSLLEWKYPKRNFAQEMMFYSSADYRSRIADAQDRINAIELEKAVLREKPDLVLVVKAVELTDRTRKHCADSGTKLVLWAYDSATQFPVILRAAPEYDLVYTYEPADLSILSEVCEPRLLPMAFDPRYYSPSSVKKEKDIDTCFVGAIDPYPQRRRLFRLLSSKLRNNTIAVWTDSVHWYSHRKVRDMFLFGARRNVQLHRQTLDHKMINDIYNRSRICLNIHHAQSVKAVNPRTFEILGSGGLLVTDRRLDDIEGFETGEGYIHYKNDAELVDEIGSLLQDDARAARIAEAGHSKGRAHTYENRAKAILKDLG